ncbi:TetR/AcrR family transcriptional regulator [Mycobacteroides chelonae]|uniref:TetR/AcrR family transcriptional regulator n=1 Tax=Mycobacteroides chelonae TaxID=1774 RepID=UPI000A72125A|nr:TetR/AcrR family transcriptional regulator [Mycobacteroides chelonae]
MEASLDVVTDVGLAGTTVRAISNTAGLNTRYFYQCFRELDELFVVLFDWIVERCVVSGGASIASAAPDLESQISAAVVGVVNALTTDPRKAWFIAYASSGNRHLVKRHAQLTRNLAVLLRAAQAERRLKADPHFLAVQAEALAAGLTGTVLAWLDGRLPLQPDELAQHSARYVNDSLFRSGRSNPYSTRIHNSREID